ncbi:acyl-CoA thioesterase-1 [Rhodobacter capsulatus]|nr:acyl-CoA thioesterase-1 [Rhodobacter capsulatus]
MRRRLGKALATGIFALGIGGTAMAEPVTLLAVGDSLTQGYGLEPDQGLVPQLESWLRAQGAEVTVINAGVSGDTTSGGRAGAAGLVADARGRCGDDRAWRQ